MENPIKMDDLGENPTIFGNICIAGPSNFLPPNPSDDGRFFAHPPLRIRSPRGATRDAQATFVSLGLPNFQRTSHGEKGRSPGCLGYIMGILLHSYMGISFNKPL